MEITEIRIKLMKDRDEKLRAFCTVTFNNEFVVRDIKVIDGINGPFVAMPSRKVTDHCSKCGGKNHLRARYCNDCGRKLDPNRIRRYRRGRTRLHTDIAHPINSACRERIQSRIVEAYEKELAASKEPGYVPDAFDDEGTYDSRARTDDGRESKSLTSSDNNGSGSDDKGKGSFDAGIFS
jgi:stage V sporulation protein G